MATRYWYPLAKPTFGEEEIAEVVDCLKTGQTTMGAKTLEFERRFAEYQGCTDAVMVNSGSSADLLLSFLLTNPRQPLLKRGDEILVPAVTWPTQVWSLMMAGLEVRLVDVDPLTLNVDLNDLVRKVGRRTRAIFLVHLLGNPCQMNRILEIVREHDLILLEDCCEALGSEWAGTKVGNFGLGAAFSFYFAHHLVTMEGGMITCPNTEFADELRIMRAHGWMRNVEGLQRDYPGIDPRYAFVNWGFNLRPTELQAAFGLRQLDKLPGFNERRGKLATCFFDFIAQAPHLSSPIVHHLAKPCWMTLPVMVSQDAPFTREQLTDDLEGNGVETRPIVTGNIARQPAAKLFGKLLSGRLPGADVVHEQGFYVGLSPLTTDSEMGRLLACFSVFLERFQ